MEKNRGLFRPRRRYGRIRNFFRSAAFASCIMVSGLMPLNAFAKAQGATGVSADVSNIDSDSRWIDPAPGLGDKGESAFRPLEPSGLSLDIPMGRIKSVDLSLMPYGFSWKLQGIERGGGLLIRAGMVLAGGEWNSQSGKLFVLGLSSDFSKGRISVEPKAYVPVEHTGIGGRLGIVFRISRGVRIYSNAYLMSDNLHKLDSMNLMIGISIDL